MDRKSKDRWMVNTAVIVALFLLGAGAATIYGGNFGLDGVRDRLSPQKIAFPAAEKMTPEEKAEVGAFAGHKVDTGPEAEAFSRYIGLHLTEVNDGKTYSETSAAARAEGLTPETQAALRQKVETLFKGETLRGMLLNAYGWWTFSQIVVYAGYGLVAAGLIVAMFAAFKVTRRTKAAAVTAPTSLRAAA